MSVLLYLHTLSVLFFFFFKQKTAYEMRISDWSSDVCSSDLQTKNDVVTLKKCLQKGFQRPFEMAQIDALVDDKAFDLMEHRRMRRVTVGTINPARRDDANRRFLPGHRADLHGRSMSAQQHAMPVALVREIECVVHRQRGMGLRDVKRTEIVPVIINLRSRDRKGVVKGKSVAVRVVTG